MDNKIAKIVVLLFMDNEIAWGCGFCGLCGGEMNSEAVSVGDTASLLGCTCGWVTLMGCPLFLGGGRLEGGF